MYILFAILLFGLMIAVHELGHFAAAKLCGVRVNEFAIGMGPTLWKRKRGETQYSVRALPIGGFCAMEGEDGDSDDPRALNRKNFWQKLLIFAAGAAMNFLLGFLMLLCIYLFSDGYVILPQVAETYDMPAGAMMQDDLIWSINGQRVYLNEDVSLLIDNGADSAEITVLRDGEKRSFTLEKRDYTDRDGNSCHGYGFAYGVLVRPDLAMNFRCAWYNTMSFARLVRMSIRMLVTGAAGIDDMSGPVGMVSMMEELGEASQQAGGVSNGISAVVYFAAMIAVNLAVMNLLPLPALDGGHIFFLCVNALSVLLFKKEIPQKYLNRINMIGFAILMAFMLLITFRDVWHLIGG